MVLPIMLIILSFVWIMSKSSEDEDIWDKIFMWFLTGKYF